MYWLLQHLKASNWMSRCQGDGVVKMKKTLLKILISLIAIMMVSCSNKNDIKNGVSDELVYNLTTPNSTKSENDTKGNMERIDYKQFLKEFWKSKKDLLEKASCDMKASGIDYVFNGKAFVIKDGIPSRIETDYPDSVDLILEQSEGKIKEFGWSRTPYPLFTKGNNFFYCVTPRFFDNHGNEISLELVFSENVLDDIDKEVNYEQLSSLWVLVVNYYGE